MSDPVVYRARNEALLVRLRAGDESAGEAMLKLNDRLVWWFAHDCVRKYAGPPPCPDVEDFYAVGLVGLWNGVKAVGACGHDNVFGYLSTCIRNEMIRETTKDHRTAGLPEGVQLEWLTSNEVRDRVDHPSAYGMDGVSVVDDAVCFSKLLDQAHASCFGPDRQIIELYLEGRSFAEIGKELQIGKTTVKDRFDKIVERTRILIAADAANAERDRARRLLYSR